MPQGLRVVGDSLVVQVDDSYYNLSLIHKGVAAATGYDGVTGLTAWIGNFNSLKAPVIAIRPTGAYHFVTLRQQDLGGGVWQFVVGTGDTAPGPGVSFEYYIFDEVTTVPAHGAGLLVFKRSARSQIAYYSNSPPMRVVQFFDGLVDGSGVTTTAAKPAFVCSSQGARVDVAIFPSENPGEYDWNAGAFIRGFRIVGSGIVAKDMFWTSASGQAPGVLPPPTRSSLANILVIDVSNQ